MNPKLGISVVIPVYNSQECLPELVRRLTKALDALDRRYEILLVNDGSPDKSWQVIVDLCQVYGTLKGINLRRNFGQDNAIMAGLNYASGEVIVIMDDDLQHDPDDIGALLAGLEKGYDVCYALFERKRQSWLKNLGSRFNDKVANLILKKPKHIYLSPFKAIVREVVDEIIKYDGPFPYVDGLLFRVTRSITRVPVAHHERFAGAGNYTLVKAIRVWLRLATNFSLVPLRLATCLGFLSSGMGFGLAAYFIIRKLMGGSPLGWASTIVTILFLGGVQLITLGIIGEYVGRTFLHGSREPQFVVRDESARKCESYEKQS